MKLLLLLLTAAALTVAGCASGPNTSSTNGDPAGDTNLSGSPDAGNNDTPGTDIPSGQHPTNPGGGAGFAIQQGTVDNKTNGIAIHVTWRACEQGFCANVTASNEGNHAVKISSICVPPWNASMKGPDGKDFPFEEPRAYCAAYGVRDFAVGEKAFADFTWDGQQHPDGKAASHAPEGGYTWRLAFVFADEEGGATMESAADIHVIIGET